MASVSGGPAGGSVKTRHELDAVVIARGLNLPHCHRVVAPKGASLKVRVAISDAHANPITVGCRIIRLEFHNFENDLS